MTRPELRFVPLTRELLEWALIEERDLVAAEQMRRSDAVGLMLRSSAYGEAMLGGGHVLGAGGLVLERAGLARAWILLSRNAGRRACIVGVRRAAAAIAAMLAGGELRRVEMTVRDGQPWRDSFARALGMQCEGKMRAFGPDGEDHWLYARVDAPR